MDNRSIEMYLRKMIEIDQEAMMIEGKVKEEDDARQKELRKAKRALEMDILKRARMEARREMETQMNEARAIESAVLEQTETEIKALNFAYEQAEDDLVRRTFEALLSGIGERKSD